MEVLLFLVGLGGVVWGGGSVFRDALVRGSGFSANLFFFAGKRTKFVL